MERNISIKIVDKVAYWDRNASIVCNNSDYTATFVFDDEWAGIETKTARFSANGKYTDVIFSGDSVKIPPVADAAYLLIGVFAGDMATTRARIPCDESILSEGGTVADPPEDVYNQIMSALDELKKNGITEDQIVSVVDKYLEENPVEAGATAEQVAQIEQNTQDIAELKEIGDKECAITADKGGTINNGSLQLGNGSNEVAVPLVSNRLVNGDAVSLQQTISGGGSGMFALYHNDALVNQLIMSTGHTEFVQPLNIAGGGTGQKTPTGVKNAFGITTLEEKVAQLESAPKPSYTAEEVGALSAETFIPSKTSELTNDSGFISGYTETDPTVPNWAKAASKPVYTASEIGALPAETFIPSKTSELTNDSGFISGYTETDPTVPNWAKAASKPVYTASEIGALPAETFIPSKTSELTNDSGFISGYTETDPTVPAWAKAASKPTYTASEVGALPEGTTIPAKTSQLSNDSGFITKAVSDLTNYYKKSESYTKSEVDAMVSAIPKFAIAVVNSLPTSEISETTIYLVKSGDEAQNLYVEYIYAGSAWEKLGEQSVDLTGYAKESWVSDKLASYQPTGDYALKSDVPSKVSELSNDKGYITGYTETDPTVPSWAKQAEKPTYTASEVGALPNSTKIPSKTSDLTNDSGFITGYTESDPTVPSWAKASSKPSYTKSEVGLSNVDNVKQYSASNPPPYPVSSVNGKTGEVVLSASDVGARADSWMPTAANVGAVPTSRTVNGKALSANISLAASDVGAVPTSSALTVTGVDADGNTHTWTMYGVAT